MSRPFEILSHTIANIGKEKNGDHHLVELIEHEQLLIAIVADGVSSQPCDWLASETTCEKLLSFFKENASEQDLSSRLLASIIQANDHVARTDGSCYKMASTLSVVVWPVKTDTFWYSNVGDSRIFSCGHGMLKQLTTDDSTITKERVFMHGGSREINRATLTKVIGQDNISFSVSEGSFGAGELLILATDGFYDARKASFGNMMIGLQQASDFERAFRATIEKTELLRGDDLTVIMIRRN